MIKDLNLLTTIATSGPVLPFIRYKKESAWVQLIARTELFHSDALIVRPPTREKKPEGSYFPKVAQKFASQKIKKVLSLPKHLTQKLKCFLSTEISFALVKLCIGLVFKALKLVSCRCLNFH